MSDALVSPAVGGTLWAAAAVVISVCARRLGRAQDDGRTALMGVLGAFVFAVQMINFTIPGTGSSGHLGGGMLLAILLGPCAGFLTIASVLAVQALVFADGGLLALGCNLVNLGVLPCFVAYPLFYRPLAGDQLEPRRIMAASIVSSVAGLQFGAFAVVLETVLSGVTALPFATFSLVMLPIHLVIGLVEGVVTAAVVNFIRKARPEILVPRPGPERSLRQVVAGFGLAAILAGGVLSSFAASQPDGLEWSIARVTGLAAELPPPDSRVHRSLARVQEESVVLPEYGFRGEKGSARGGGSGPLDAGTPVSGLVGGGLTLGIGMALGILLRRRRAKLELRPSPPIRRAGA